MNKKGLSVVTILIILILSLIVIGAVWIIIPNITSEKNEQTDYSPKCLLADVKIENANYDTTLKILYVNLKRISTSGEEIEIGGVKMVYTSPSGNSDSEDFEGNIPFLATKSITSKVLTEKPTKVTATVYFKKEDKTKYYCLSESILSNVMSPSCVNLGGTCKSDCSVQEIDKGQFDCSGTYKCCK